MKRWTRSLSDQLDIINRHTDALIERLTFLSFKTKGLSGLYKQKPTAKRKNQIDDLTEKIFYLVKELKCREAYVLEKWPHLKPFFQGIQEDTPFVRD